MIIENIKIYSTGKAVLRGKFIPLNAYVKKQGRFNINNLRFHLKKLKKDVNSR